MYEVCEGLRVSYTFGLSANAVLQRETEGLLAEAVAGYERQRQAARQQDPPRPAVPSRLFTGFWYQSSCRCAAPSNHENGRRNRYAGR